VTTIRWRTCRCGINRSHPSFHPEVVLPLLSFVQNIFLVALNVSEGESARLSGKKSNVHPSLAVDVGKLVSCDYTVAANVRLAQSRSQICCNSMPTPPKDNLSLRIVHGRDFSIGPSDRPINGSVIWKYRTRSCQRREWDRFGGRVCENLTPSLNLPL
jgi:hypothetical protein